MTVGGLLQSRPDALGLDLELLARAAMAMRYRELRGEQAARRRLRRFEEGRAAGVRWVVVEESGDPEGDPYRPYSRLEVAATTRRRVPFGCSRQPIVVKLQGGLGPAGASRP